MMKDHYSGHENVENMIRRVYNCVNKSIVESNP